jgi:LPS export ABC transporter protein LptC
MTLRFATLVLMLALVAAASLWLQRELDLRTPEVIRSPSLTTGTEAAGDFPPGGRSNIAGPVIQWHETGLPPLTIESERGWVAHEGEEIRLLGRVTIDRPATHPDGPLQLVTADLRLFPQDQRATTASRVVATSPSYRIEGVGMEMDMKAQRIVLLSNVEGEHAP